VAAVVSLAAVAPVHEHVQQGTRQEEHVRQDAEDVRPVLRDVEEAGDAQKTEQREVRG
jgi:hypothetical protein